jgi:hypothetical protein
MARSAYILCAESGAVDKDSGRVSHFNVIERLQIGLQVLSKPDPKNPKPIGIVQTFDFFIYAVWALGYAEKPGDEYEIELTLKKPWDSNAAVVYSGRFVFEQFNQKFIIHAKVGLSGEMKSGDLVVESRIRKDGTKTWISQQYNIPIDVAPIPEEVAKALAKQSTARSRKSKKQ